MKKIITIIIYILIGFANLSIADEGMWIPILLEKYNIQDMQTKGFKLSAEDIYSINQDCLMDAVVIFGRGCTGEVVSDKGLLLTNHHCGYGAIQKHSSIDRDYLTNGFWAMKQSEELPNPGLTVKFLKRIEDVTGKVLENVSDNLSEIDRESIIKLNIEKIEAETLIDTNYIVSIKPFFYGNQYFLFIYEEYKDVRLVGAPPSSIGKFGGDTDNWMWPRHTGDFSIFRIYANRDNKPAEYSPDNVPYNPKKFLSISIKGINEGDFTWVMGYPGSTQEYLTSDAIKLIAEVRNPNLIKLRDIRLEIMNRYMDSNDTIRIKYSSKNASVSNSWKRWKGEIEGLRRLKTIEKKQQQEEEFKVWAKENHKIEFLGLIDSLKGIYQQIEEYAIAYDYWRESIKGVEIINFISDFTDIINIANTDITQEEFNLKLNDFSSDVDKFFKDYVMAIDKETFLALVLMYFSNVDSRFQPDLNLNNVNDLSDYLENLYKNTIFNNKNNLTRILAGGSKEEIANFKNDPLYKLYEQFYKVYISSVFPVYDSLQNQTDKLYRLYLKGLQEMNPHRIYYSDANFTMRVSYGNVEGYTPRDAVEYKYYTTLDGVIEKVNPEIYDYNVPQKLKELYQKKDFGQYSVNGTVPVCFIATNHTTGGNSGSPVLDAEGNLIGLNFDRDWDGIQSDMMFDPERSRNVTLDIRYLLFIVDKLAGAEHLINEMRIIR